MTGGITELVILKWNCVFGQLHKQQPNDLFQCLFFFHSCKKAMRKVFRLPYCINFTKSRIS